MNTKHTQHTPGPWEVCRALSTTHATPIRWKGENLAWVCGLDSAHLFTHKQTAANAALISAAPDLLEALRGLMNRAAHDAELYAPEGNEPIWAWIDDASNAITKAEGKAE